MLSYDKISLIWIGQSIYATVGRKFSSSSKAQAQKHNDVQRNHASVVDMDPVVESYHDVYAADLEE